MTVVNEAINNIIQVFQDIAYSLAPGLEEAGVGYHIFWAVFFLSYVLIFSLLNYVHFLKDNDRAKIIVALVLALFISSNTWSLALISSAFPPVGVLLTIGLAMLILVAVFSPRLLKDEKIECRIFLAPRGAGMSTYALKVYQQLIEEEGKNERDSRMV